MVLLLLLEGGVEDFLVLAVASGQCLAQDALVRLLFRVQRLLQGYSVLLLQLRRRLPQLLRMRALRRRELFQRKTTPFIR